MVTDCADFDNENNEDVQHNDLVTVTVITQCDEGVDDLRDELETSNAIPHPNIALTEDGGVASTLRSTSRQRSLPQIPSFVDTPTGEALCISIMSMARTDRFENSLAYGKRDAWFASKIPVFFEDVNGIFAPYRRVGEQQIRKRFTEA